MRKPNNYGGVAKLKGNRRKPYKAYINVKITKGVNIPPPQQKSFQDKINALYDIDNTVDVAIQAAIIKYDIEMLSKDKETYVGELVADLNSLLKNSIYKSYTAQKAIGYYATSTEAHIALADYNRNPITMTGNEITFKEVYELAYKDNKIDRKAESTQKTYKQGFDKCSLIHNMIIADVKLSHLDSIMASLTGYSKSVQTRVITVLKMVYEYAMKHELVTKNHSDYVKLGDTKEAKMKTALSRQEVQMLWDNIEWKYNGDASTDGVEIPKLLLILCYTGLRINELLQLKSEDVKNGYLEVKGTKTSSAKRLVPIHPSIASLISTKYEYVITNKNGEPIKYEALKDVPYKKFRSDFGFNHTFHEMRHTFSTYSMSMDTVLRQYILGHKNKNITDDVYTHPEVLQAELMEEIKKLTIVKMDE